jgi:hypothetical protein
MRWLTCALRDGTLDHGKKNHAVRWNRVVGIVDCNGA